ncbi:hypothetical protein HQ529_04390 [Candidatus Woesearchaeota archaeon]|nr:hypothetical protein [Candidatus Woesearchaeota archaeon]
MFGLLALVFGVLFLLQDLGVWAFWGVNWWTVLFLLAGVGTFGTTGCPTCKAEKKK